MAYEDNLDGRDQSGNVVENTLTAAFAETLVPGGGYGTSIAENDDLRFSRGNSVAVMDHMGKALTLNGTTQYAYHADDDKLDVGEEDFAISFLVKTTRTSADGLIWKRSGVGKGYGLGISGVTAGKLSLYVDDDVSIVNGTNFSSNVINTGNWVSVFCVFDRSGYAYSFIDGAFNVAIDISGVVTSLTNAIQFIVGAKNTGVDGWFGGQLDQVRLFRFGKNGLYVTNPTGGGTNLKIQVGSSSGYLIWDDTNTSNLIKLMYQSPYESLTNLGYGSLEDADPSYSYESDFTSGVDGFTSINGTAFAPVNDIGTADDDYNLRLTVDGTSWVHYLQKTSRYVVGKTYSVSFDYFVPSGQSNIDGVYLNGVHWQTQSFHSILDTWTTVNKTFVATHADFAVYSLDGAQISFQDAGANDVFYIRNVKIKESGVVAHYKFNGDLTDETSNGLDLTGVNSPTYTTNYLV